MVNLVSHLVWSISYLTWCDQSNISPGVVNLVGHLRLLLQVEHLLYERGEQVAQVPLAIEAEAVGHDLAGQAVATEQRLHAVRHLHLHIAMHCFRNHFH